MALFALLAVSCLAIVAESQFNNYQLDILNPDLIYFNDGRQRNPYLAVLPLSRIGENQQGPGGPPPRNPVNMIPQLPHSPNAGEINKNQFKMPSPDLEPPHQGSSGNEPSQALPVLEDRFGEASEGQNQNSAGVQTVVPTASVEKVSLAVSQFGINIMKTLQNQPGNVVTSPYSIATLLALLQQGSLGATQQQISNALQMNPNEAADGFKRLAENLQKRQSQNLFNVGNGLFLADGFNINPAFKRIAMMDFHSDVIPIKFTRPDQAAAKINNWIASKTNNKIDKLVTSESVGDNTQMALVNAVYFKGLWKMKFRPQATLLNEFHLFNGGTKMVNFMRMRRYFRTGYDTSIGSQILILPFEGEQYSLVVILPSASATVTSVISSLTPDRLLAYQNMSLQEVALEIPKFTVKSDTSLVSVFQQLGITNIFGPASDLSGLGNFREFSPQVSSALHSALLSIDEQGGTAAAATSFGVVALSYDDPSIAFKADRPFLTVLWDNQTSTPLFMAKIEDPVQ